jgi:hypothetical protein
MVSSILNPDINNDQLRNALIDEFGGQELSRQWMLLNQDQIT